MSCPTCKGPMTNIAFMGPEKLVCTENGEGCKAADTQFEVDWQSMGVPEPSARLAYLDWWLASGYIGVLECDMLRKKILNGDP